MRDSILKALLLFIIASFALVTLSHATPAPAKNNQHVAGKKAISKPVVKGKKTVKANKKGVVAPQKYKVRAGDSLYTIAKRQGMKIADLQRLNGLKSSRLKIGQTLVVSGKAKKPGKVQENEIVEESGQVISDCTPQRRRPLCRFPCGSRCRTDCPLLPLHPLSLWRPEPKVDRLLWVCAAGLSGVRYQTTSYCP